jgi:hypothetical protein
MSVGRSYNDLVGPLIALFGFIGFIALVLNLLLLRLFFIILHFFDLLDVITVGRPRFLRVARPRNLVSKLLISEVIRGVVNYMVNFLLF